jgi:hypothetical protein
VYYSCRIILSLFSSLLSSLSLVTLSRLSLSSLSLVSLSRLFILSLSLPSSSSFCLSLFLSQYYHCRSVQR